MRLKTLILSTLLLLSFMVSGLPRNQISPSIFSVEKSGNSIVFRQTDSSQVALPCQSVASIQMSGNNSNTITVYYQNNADYEKSLAFDYSVCGFASKTSAFDSLVDWSICDTSGGGGQTLAISNDTLSISGGNSVVLPTSGGGGAALSDLTDATDTNTISNVGQQEWRWNALSSGIGLKLSSNSTAAASNTQTLMSIDQSGANATGGQTTYGLRISNTKTGATNTNIGAYFAASGAASANIAVDIAGDARILDNQVFLFGTGATGLTASAGIRTNTSAFQFQLYSATSQCINLVSKIARGVLASDASGVVYINLANNSSTKHSISFGGDNVGTTNYRSVDVTAAVIEQDGGKLHLCANTGLGGGFGNYTPNQIMTINGGSTVAASNVGIGTTSPNSSSLLDLVSTTKFLTPPRMTEAQRDAVGSPQAGDTLFCTDCTATDASTGVMQTYNGTTWKNYW